MANGIFVDGNFVWNMDANVGPGAPNKPEDVQLVQLGYVCFAAAPGNTVAPAALKALCAKVVPGTAYTGNPNDPLTIAIRAHEKARGGTQDGVVSTIKNQSGLYDAKMRWILVALNHDIAEILGPKWPRLDVHPACPTALKAAVNRVFGI